MNQMQQTVITIIAEATEIEASFLEENLVKQNFSLLDIGIDSLDYLDIRFGLSKEYGIKLQVDDLESLTLPFSSLIQEIEDAQLAKALKAMYLDAEPELSDPRPAALKPKSPPVVWKKTRNGLKRVLTPQR